MIFPESGRLCGSGNYVLRYERVTVLSLGWSFFSELKHE